MTSQTRPKKKEKGLYFSAVNDIFILPHLHLRRSLEIAWPVLAVATPGASPRGPLLRAV